MTQRKERVPIWRHSVAVAKELEMAVIATGTFGVATGKFGRVCIDDNIAERVTQALWANPFVDPSNIAVAVDASGVVLKGMVDTEEQIDLVTAILEGLYCVDHVVNDLKIARDMDVVLSTAA